MYDIISRDDIDDIHEAAAKCKTRYFWYVDHGVDCTGFDFNWVPVPWESEFVHIFPSKWQRDGGIRLVNKQHPEEQIKLHNSNVVPRESTKRNWILNDDTDYSNFDFSWHPDNLDDDFTYVFPSQWQRDGGTYYVTEPGAPKKYVSDQVTKRTNCLDNWKLPNVDTTEFDFSWHPDPAEKPYTYVFASQWQRDSGTHYITEPGAPRKYANDQTTIRDVPVSSDTSVVSADNIKHTSDIKHGWKLHEDTDYSNFDFSWHPDPSHGDFTYVFPSQWQRDGGTYYVTSPNAPRKYVSDQVTKRIPNKDNWSLNKYTDYTNFDFSWHPDPSYGNYTYVFPSQWQRDGGTYYVTALDSPKKYISDQVTKRTNCLDNWELPDNIDTSEFDFSWHPDPSHGDYTYVFPSLWQRNSNVCYTTKEGAPKKYVSDQVIRPLPKKEDWIIPSNIDEDSFDFSWMPDPDDPPYIYVFGTQWQEDGGPIYEVEGATKINYIDEPRAKALPTTEHWHTDSETDYSTFDFSWHPEESQKDFKHVFGSQWQKTSKTFYYNGNNSNPKINYVTDQRVTSKSDTLPRYNIETTLEDLINDHPTERFWALNSEMDYEEFDFSWHPDASQMDYVHVFGSQWQKHSQTFYVNAPAYLKGNTHLNFVGDQKVVANSTLDIFYIDKGGENSAERFKSLLLRHPQMVKTRFFGNIRDTLLRCAKKSNTGRFWAISSENNYDSFNFDWHCEPWQNGMLHVFGSKWNKWSNTFLVNADDFIRTFDWAENIEDVYNLNFVEDQQVQLYDDNREIWYVDFGNNVDFAPLLEYNKARFFGNWLETLTRIVERTDEDYIWVCGSICDYSSFDFGWEPEPWQQDMLHVFPSNKQLEGDTFYVPVKKFKEQSSNLKVLGWFDTVNYVKDINVSRCSWPIVNNIHELDTLYGWILHNNQKTIDYDPPFWKTPELHVFNRSGSVSLVPRDCKREFRTQLYDYPHILRHSGFKCEDKPLDIVFISNGEKNANKNWDHLVEVYKNNNCTNTLLRSSGVNGRTQAYQAAANLSRTEWFYAVFAKTEVMPDFKFDLVPNYLEETKHYMLHSRNPLNGLEYGAMNINMYNRQLTLDTKPGLDFT